MSKWHHLLVDLTELPPPPSDWSVCSPRPGSIARIEAWFGSNGYDPYRQDTYSIDRPGMQSFHDKGALHHGVPGNS